MMLDHEGKIRRKWTSGNESMHAFRGPLEEKHEMPTNLNHAKG
jgi:hypothetical protein